MSRPPRRPGDARPSRPRSAPAGRLPNPDDAAPADERPEGGRRGRPVRGSAGDQAKDQGPAPAGRRGATPLDGERRPARPPRAERAVPVDDQNRRQARTATDPRPGRGPRPAGDEPDGRRSRTATDPRPGRRARSADRGPDDRLRSAPGTDPGRAPRRVAYRAEASPPRTAAMPRTDRETRPLADGQDGQRRRPATDPRPARRPRPGDDEAQPVRREERVRTGRPARTTAPTSRDGPGPDQCARRTATGEQRPARAAVTGPARPAGRDAAPGRPGIAPPPASRSPRPPRPPRQDPAPAAVPPPRPADTAGADLIEAPVLARAAGREPQRIAKLLARAGVASRREIERMIADGRIAVEGRTLDTPATLLRSLHGVTVDGQAVAQPAPARLFRFHKPTGLLTAERDPQGRPTIYDRLPADLPRLVPVGRLDLNTEGLLLLTTDGGLKRQLELPSMGVERTYRARAYGQVSQDQLEELIEGVEVDGVRYGRIDANLERRTGTNTWIELKLTEGKNREVRRVLEHLGLRVSRLIRLSYGPFALADLAAGQVEEVRQHDLVAFRKTLR